MANIADELKALVASGNLGDLVQGSNPMADAIRAFMEAQSNQEGAGVTHMTPDPNTHHGPITNQNVKVQPRPQMRTLGIE